MAVTTYASNVFINCPFDPEYLKLRNALVFAIYDCGFSPRCALEEDNSGDVRFEKILALITNSKFGIHDISRTESDRVTKLPRFNMPLELGVFLGAKRFGGKQHKSKNCLILDREQYRYQSFISDISGNAIQSHDGDQNTLITRVRDWLNNASGRRTIPGGKEIARRFHIFEKDLPGICKEVRIEIDELTYSDYSAFISGWLADEEGGSSN